jgi:C4-dicarboxylate transporter DctM subunit
MAYPEMRRFNYDKGLALGTISSAGTFASMIPPSIGLVLYGIVTEEGIGQLLMAGILPGCITILAYMAVIWFVCWRNPRLAPRVETKYTLQEKLKGSLDIWGIMVLFILIMGGIYTGLFPPTVGAAIGAFGAFVLAISTRKLNTGAKLRNLALSTVKGVSSLTIILVGGFLFARFLVLSGFVEDLVGLVTIGGIPPVAVIGLICLMYIVLGCAMDPMSMLVCTMPFIYPLVIALGYDGIWFGIIYTKVSEIGCVTPPVGMNLYVVAAAAGDDVSVIDVAKGIVPFIFADLAVLIMLIAFPGIPLLIPNKMFQNG